jgi:hypothetical protein
MFSSMQLLLYRPISSLTPPTLLHHFSNTSHRDETMATKAKLDRAAKAGSDLRGNYTKSSIPAKTGSTVSTPPNPAAHHSIKPIMNETLTPTTADSTSQSRGHNSVFLYRECYRPRQEGVSACDKEERDKRQRKSDRQRRK